ncbi:MAG: DUF4231 domain-containing protein [Nitrosarchaeum sp.]|nr:DUF4231 domain-containing protein [Nitrosarchaeum sp.]
MNKSEFEKYVNDRYYDQVKWYDKKSKHNQSAYVKLQWLLIVSSAMTPVLIAISFGLSEYSYLKWISIIIAVIVTITSSVIRIFKFHENWITYRTTCETLKKEIHYYNADVGEYYNNQDKESTFVQRVESLISQENTLWLNISKKEDTKINP